MEMIVPVNCGCGGQPKIEKVIYAGDECYIVKCSECKTSTYRFPTREGAVFTWNKALGGKNAVIETGKVKPNKYYRNDGWNYYCPKCGRAVKHKKTILCPTCGVAFEWKGV